VMTATASSVRSHRLYGWMAQLAARNA